ncbi:MAG: hypothetical protein JO222_07085 [Frankiales bacterium]|nr:hypothetical protein [Frankiales bacterium]
MAEFVFGILFILLGVGTALFGVRALRHREIHVLPAQAGGAAGILLGLLLVVLSCTVSIPTQDIGVVTVFGHPEGALSNGLHLKAPWARITTLDNAIQTDTYASNGFNGPVQDNAQGGCVNVRIARQATACVNVTIRWQERKSGVDYLFRNYRNNDNIRDQLLHRDLQTAVNLAFADYDPLGLNAAGDSTQPNTAELARTVQTQLTAQVGPWINVSRVFIPLFNFDADTQKRLNLLQTQVAQTRVAQQSEQTAAAQAKANRILAQSVSNSPGVLVSKCLDILAEAVQKDQALPAGFSCFGGTNTSVAVK